MAATNGAPMDEIQWRLEEAVAHFGGIRAENIHLYFLASPFCDSSSNNKALENQLRYQPDSFHVLQDRSAFEAKLRQLNSGIEYIISDGPKQTTADTNPVWTIRKQRRTKQMRTQDSRGQVVTDKIEILGTYYAVGENIYQAPSVMDILSNRLLTIEDNMQKILNTAASMQYFSPSTGHRYTLDKAAATSEKSTAPEVETQIDTVMSEGAEATANEESSLAENSSEKLNSTEQSLLFKSLNMSIRYGSEYIDTNPLLGEPGSLHFSSTESHLQAQAAAKAKAAADKLTKEANSATHSGISSPATESKSLFARKGSKGEKLGNSTNKMKRRKSRITGSPDDD